jgi:serine/threonine protein phosphatase PrpC
MTNEQENADIVKDAPAIELAAWCVTDVGMVREHNEDSSHSNPTAGFFIVADGMGGHAAGEVASAMTVESVAQSLLRAQDQIASFVASPDESGRRGLVQTLQSAVLTAHQSVFARGSAEPEKQGMGTTLDVLLVAGAEAFVAHVGDSRTYLIRDGECSQITTDHTVAEVLLIEGKLTPEEAAISPMRTVLVNAIGVSAEVGVEMAHLQLQKDDRLLICSDGLHDYFPSEDEISAAMTSGEPGAALQFMVDQAKERGGHDNITGIAVLVTSLRVDTANYRSSGVVSEALERDSTQPVELAVLSDISETSSAEIKRPVRTGRSSGPRVTQPLRAIRSPSVPPIDKDVFSDARGNEPTEPIGRVTPPIGLRAFGDNRNLAHADTLPPDVKIRNNPDGSFTVEGNGQSQSSGPPADKPDRK